MNYNAMMGLKNMLTYDPEMFFYYGSGTTPPCSEDVFWMIFSKPRSISERQMNTLKLMIAKMVTEKGVKEGPSRFNGNNREIKVFIIFFVRIFVILFIFIFSFNFSNLFFFSCIIQK